MHNSMSTCQLQGRDWSSLQTWTVCTDDLALYRKVLETTVNMSYVIQTHVVCVIVFSMNCHKMSFNHSPLFQLGAENCDDSTGKHLQTADRPTEQQIEKSMRPELEVIMQTATVSVSQTKLATYKHLYMYSYTWLSRCSGVLQWCIYTLVITLISIGNYNTVAGCEQKTGCSGGQWDSWCHGGGGSVYSQDSDQCK